MPRPKTKIELIEMSEDNFHLLNKLVRSLPEQSLEISGVCEIWSIKDILAHLHAWHMLCLTWYQEGQSGQKPAMPAPGYNWNQTPELNQVLYEEYKDEPFPDILKSLEESHDEILAVIKIHTEQELFTKKLYKWTGSTSMASYFISTATSHYDWALELIKKWIKANPDLAK